MVTQVPADETILRLRHAIHEKYRKYRQYREADVIASDEPYIIGINSKRISTIVSDPEVPLIVKAVFPLGDLTAVFDKREARIVETYHSHRDFITKQSESRVSTDIFLDTKYGGISAVLYSCVDAVNCPSSFGADFRFVHNPLAANPVPRGTLRFGVEYWVHDDQLIWKNWNEDTV